MKLMNEEKKRRRRNDCQNWKCRLYAGLYECYYSEGWNRNVTYECLGSFWSMTLFDGIFLFVLSSYFFLLVDGYDLLF